MRLTARALARSAALVGGAAALCYGWWISSLAPFTTASYLAIAAPIALALSASGVAEARRPYRSTSVPIRLPLPALALVGAGVGLELAALALGGRSASWPSLSGVLDHLVTTRLLRLLTFEVWIALGGYLVCARGARH